ncbi:MAG: MFS transporter [candidate division WOR-3 bacterium]
MPSRLITVLKNRNFLYLALAGAMSQLGDRLSHMLLITVIGMSAPGKLLAYSGGSLAFVIPTLVLSPVAGVLVDRWNRRNTIARTHFIQTAILGLTPFAIALTRSFVPFWIALTLFFGLDIFNNTANPALLPSLVARDEILAANSASLFFSRIATVLGMVIGGFLIKWVGWQRGIWIDASCHLVAGILVLNIGASITRPLSANPLAHGLHSEQNLVQEIVNAFVQFFRELAEVIRLVFINRLVAFVLGSIVVSTFISAVAYTILIYLVQQVLGMGTAGVGIFAGILAIGMIAGAVVIGLMPKNINRPLIVAVVILIYGLLFFIGNWLITLWFMILVAVIAGIAFSWLGVVQNTMLQEEVAENIRGRIFSTREFITNATFLLTTLFIGTLGDVTSYRLALVEIGIVLLILGTAALLGIRSFYRRTAGHGQ